MLIETLQQVNFYLFFKYLRRVGMARFYLEISVFFFRFMVLAEKLTPANLPRPLVPSKKKKKKGSAGVNGKEAKRGCIISPTTPRAPR